MRHFIVSHNETIYTGNVYRKGYMYLMLHHLAGATIQVENIVNCNYYPKENGNIYQ